MAKSTRQRAHPQGTNARNRIVRRPVLAIAREAASRTSPEALAAIPDVDWKSVKGIRARIVHDYRQLDLLVIGGVVSRQMPKLISATRKALASAEQSP